MTSYVCIHFSNLPENRGDSYLYAPFRGHPLICCCVSTKYIFVFLPLVVVELNYTCGVCLYTPCDVSCGVGERRGEKHCVLYDRNMTTIINEFDERCPPEICTVPCETVSTTSAVVPTTSHLRFNYTCDPCVYSPCDSTCGLGEQSGSQHCVLIDTTNDTVVQEYDIDCARLSCHTACETTAETDPSGGATYPTDGPTKDTTPGTIHVVLFPKHILGGLHLIDFAQDNSGFNISFRLSHIKI